ncbi:MAG: hypothetical protein R2780_01615 [Crocinitomicaceae bacterium]|nr:hypothetical protein [Crocinitomicaceae bacterium]
MFKCEKYETSFGEIEHLLDDVLIIRYDKINRIEEEHVKSISHYRDKIIGDKKYYAISDVRTGIVTFTNEAKQYLAQERSIQNRRHLDIVIVSNWASKMEVQLYLKLFKPLVDTQVVRTVDEALDLIEAHRNMS